MTEDIVLEKDRVYAGFWIRFLASFIDSFLLVVFLGFVLYQFFGINVVLAEIPYDEIKSHALLYTYIAIQNIFPLIIVIYFWMRYKATPGKMICGLEIINNHTGKRIGFFRSLVRWFSYIISIAPFFLGYFWVFVDKEKRTFHDIIAGTVVIEKPKKKW